MFESKICYKCGGKLEKIEHYEHDGITKYGSYEPYFECVNKCEQEEALCMNNQKISNCCSAPLNLDIDRCPVCGEGCGVENDCKLGPDCDCDNCKNYEAQYADRE